MSTWFTLIARVAQVEPVPTSGYQNALCQFLEGSRRTDEEWTDPDDGEWRSVNVSFYGDLMVNDRSYIIFGTARLCSYHEAIEPKVCPCRLNYGTLML
jgi:hypothetical protein